ncbi:MAG: methyltransferase [Bacteroidales bacterium]|nr:methyltransferase [Bacteroidales bacterium]NMD04063.1 O-methyltransferase [Bacteroidales bacterium]HOU02960.1 O-methyltransferase [Bacteroidales bacterium]HQK69068.1 O-methyltransferase [Bacteroidales bacterium]
MDKRIEKYIIDHSSPEDPVLEELYRQTHIKFVNPNMSTGYLQGRFLEFMSRMIKPSNILEIGTFTGYSAICLAKGLAEGGKLTTIEINDELREFAHEYFRKAGLDNRIIQLTGRAQDIIPELDQIFDLVYIDGDKREYNEYYNICLRKTRPGSFIIADNVLWGDKVLDKNTKDPQSKGIIEFNELIRSQKNIEKIILPIRDGLMIIRL